MWKKKLIFENEWGRCMYIKQCQNNSFDQVSDNSFMKFRFNRREEEFATLKDYNDYLEEVETITFNLLNNIEVAATEAKLASYAKANADIINHNISIEQQEIADQETHRAAEREQARIRRETARREDEEDRQMLKEGRREVIDLLAKTSSADSSTAEKIARQGQQKILLKRSSAARHRTQQQQHQISASDDSQAMPTFQFKGLKPPPKPRIHDLNQTPYDPFMGLRHLNTPDYFILRKPNNDDDENNNGHYEHPWLERARSDQSILAGGYDLREYYTRCLTEAYEGLGVFLEEEVGGRRERGKGSISTGALDDSLEGNGDTS